jgi:hypothetical protein
MSQHQPSHTALARLAARRGVLLAAVLEGYQVQQHLDDAALAAQIGCSPEGLTHLKLCEAPRPERFDEDVAQVAAHVGADPAKLAAALKGAVGQ